jgi:CRP/FNR family transcriptional regulator
MSTAPDWLHSLPALERLDAEALDLLSKAATRVELKAGTVLFRPGDACASFLIVLAGSVRVQLLSEAGREIVLYRVGPGSTCVLTTSCLIGSEGYGAEGIAETAVSAVALPKDSFDRLITQCQAPEEGRQARGMGRHQSGDRRRLGTILLRRADADA